MINHVPAIRSEVTFDIHVEGDGSEHLLLSCSLDLVDSPIIVDTNLIGLFEIMDGTMTWDEFRTAVNLDDNEQQWLRLRAFIGQLDALGFLQTEEAERRMRDRFAEWDAADVRPAAFAGSAYPEESQECAEFLDDVLEPASASVQCPEVILGAHLDFRVSNTLYTPWRSVAGTDADIVVLIGTSHYSGDYQVMLTRKHFATPFGVVPTDAQLVANLASALESINTLGTPILSPTDRMHRSEHSLEFHVVLLRHLLADKMPPILPILVGPLVQDDADRGAIVDAIANVVQASGKKVLWCISGDLAHVGHRFGDDEPAAELLEQVRVNDTAVLALLERGEADSWRRHIERQHNRYRICGSAPVWFGLKAAEQCLGKLRGSVERHHVWDDTDTNSAVSAATVVFHNDLEK